MSTNPTPPDAWRTIDEWPSWNDLPAMCCYRLRLVDSNGSPVPIPRLLDPDPSGLLYIGETGPDEKWPGPHRVAALAADLAPRVNVDGHGRTIDERVTAAVHGVGKTFRAIDLIRKLRRRWPGCSLQMMWEETTDMESLVSTGDVTNANAAVDANDPKARNRDLLAATEGVIGSSGKELARRREKQLLDEYEDRFGEPPPLNSKAGEFMRNKDQRTEHTVQQSVVDVSQVGDRSVVYDILNRLPREVIESFLTSAQSGSGPDGSTSPPDDEVSMGDGYEELKRRRGGHD